MDLGWLCLNYSYSVVTELGSIFYVSSGHYESPVSVGLFIEQGGGVDELLFVEWFHDDQA